MNLRGQLVTLSLSMGAVLLPSPAASAAAQNNTQCSFATDSVVSDVLGKPVHGYADPGTTPSFEACEFDEYTLFHQTGAAVVGPPGLAGLAQNVVLGLPAEVAAQIASLGPGQTIDLPGYQVATLGGLGDAALWVKDSRFGVDALVVQRGSEVFAFQVLDRPDAQVTTTALARAVVANAPPAAAVSPPTGNRPTVGADCGLDAANAVADRLQRADVTMVNVIGGCHYVFIDTTLDGGGFDNAATARQICDTASEVAYSSSGILGITVTDRNNHDRASGANGEPCSGFP